MGHEALEAEKKYPSGWKVGPLRCKNSQALLFLERTFLFLDLDCLTERSEVRQLSDLGKEKFSLGKETSPSSFSISEQPLSSSTEHIFYAGFFPL